MSTSDAQPGRSGGDNAGIDDVGATEATGPTAGRESPPDEPSGKPRRLVLFGTIATIVVIIDQVAKAIAVATLTPGVSPHILGGLIYFSLIRNPGAAFSMATGMTWVLALIAICVVIAIIRLAPRLHSAPWAVALGLVLGGAMGNLADRIFRSPGVLRGWVVDYISVFGPDAKYFPAFNLADSAITIGAITLVITALLGIDFDGTRARRRKAPAGDSTGRRGG